MTAGGLPRSLKDIKLVEIAKELEPELVFF
jgi:hypothetical protein